MYYRVMKKPTSKIAGRRAAARALALWTAAREGASIAALRGPSRVRSLSRVRAICGHLARKVADLPIAAVAAELERDPSTIWRDVQWLEEEMRSDRALAKAIRETEAACARWLKTAD